MQFTLSMPAIFTVLDLKSLLITLLIKLDLKQDNYSTECRYIAQNDSRNIIL